MPTLRDAVIALAEAKHREAQARTKRLAAEKALIDAMKTTGESKVEVEFDTGDILRGTMVTGQMMSIDEDRLRERLTPEQWEEVSERVLDTDLLEAAVAENKIAANTVLECTDWKDKKPYVRVSGMPPSLLPGVQEAEVAAREELLKKPAMRSKRVRAKKS